MLLPKVGEALRAFLEGAKFLTDPKVLHDVDIVTGRGPDRAVKGRLGRPLLNAKLKVCRPDSEAPLNELSGGPGLGEARHSCQSQSRPRKMRQL